MAVLERCLIKLFNGGCSMHFGTFKPDEHHGQVVGTNAQIGVGVTPLLPSNDYERLVVSHVIRFLHGQQVGPSPAFENHLIETGGLNPGLPVVPEGT